LYVLYFFAFAIINLGISIPLMRQIGLIHVAWWNVYTLHLATFFHVLFISLTLSERMHAAEKKALEAAQGSEKKALVSHHAYNVV